LIGFIFSERAFLYGEMNRTDSDSWNATRTVYAVFYAEGNLDKVNLAKPYQSKIYILKIKIKLYNKY